MPNFKTKSSITQASQNSDAAPGIIYAILGLTAMLAGFNAYLSAIMHNPMSKSYFKFLTITNLITPVRFAIATIVVLLIVLFLNFDNIYKNSYLNYAVFCLLLLALTWSFGAFWPAKVAPSQYFMVPAVLFVASGALMIYTKHLKLSQVQIYVVLFLGLIALLIFKFAFKVSWLHFVLGLIETMCVTGIIYLTNGVLAQYATNLKQIFKSCLMLPVLAFKQADQMRAKI